MSLPISALDLVPFLQGGTSVEAVRNAADLARAWGGTDSLDQDSWQIVDPDELKRFARTYRDLPPLPADFAGKQSVYVVK